MANNAFVPAPLGLHTRLLIAAYTRNTLIVLSGVLVIALSIDLATFLPQILAADGGSGFTHQVFYVGWYILMRCTDQIAEFLPLASFLGVVWSEVTHTRSGERLLIQLSGREPRQCLAPLLIFAVIVGTIEASFLIYLRPAAVASQTAAHLGLYGKIFDRSTTAERKWIVTNNTIIHARINFLAPAFYDIELYRFDVDGQLQRVIQAASAVPANDKDWAFIDGQSWTVDTPRTPSDPSPGLFENANNGTRFERMTTRLDIAVPWLRNFGIQSKYLTDANFRIISQLSFYPDSEFKAWAQARYTFALDAAAMVIMAGWLSLMLLNGRISFFRSAAIIIAGYFAYLLMRLFLLLASNDWLNPIAAAWLVPTLILTFPMLVYGFRRLTSRSGDPEAMLNVDFA